MDFVNNLLLGFQVIVDPINLLFCFIGVFVGTLVGVLPGIGPVGAMAILLPITFGVPLSASIIMLAGIFYGAQYGGSITSILINIPGEASTAMTCLDGYQMARQGRAGPALGIAGWGSFIAGTLSTIGLMSTAVPLSQFALRFGPPEYFAFMCTGLIIVIYLVHGSVLKGLMMALLGLLIGCVGLDSVFGLPRFTFGIYNLDGGVSLVPVLMGLFGISEVLTNIERSLDREIFQARIGNVWPSLKDWSASLSPILRGSVLGFLIGILPGGGPILTSFVSYAVEKKVSKHPERFGKGAIEGVAGPESANNACIASNMMPLFSLGIPVHASMALLFSAIIIHGIEPGPLFIKETPEVFWGLIASMYVGNVFLLILNIPLIPLWVQILRIPYRLLFAFITLFCLVGAYSLDNSAFDLILAILFGVVGYLIKKFGYEPAPLVLAFVLGPMMERNLRQSLLLSDGSFSIFFTRPISAVALGVAFLLLMSTLILNLGRYRQKFEKLED